MSNEMVSEYEILHARPEAFYECFERKDELQHQTHYCPGADTASCTRCWRGRSTSWASRPNDPDQPGGLAP